MTVSIVIPCYNHARFVAEAVESACRQTWAPLEVIVVDDGSTDGSGAVAARHPGVTVVTQENRGLSAARNAGLAASRGDIVIFLDADDRLLRGAVQHAVDAFARHPNAGMVFGRCLLIDEDGRPMLTNLPEVKQDFYAELLRRNFIWTPGMVAFKRMTLDLVGPFDRQVNPSADYDMYLRVARRHAIASHDAAVVEYRQSPGSMSRDPVTMLRTTLRVLEGQEEFVEQHPLLGASFDEGRQNWRRFYGEQLVDRFRAALHGARYGAALSDAWTLARTYPEGVRRHLRKKGALMLGMRPRPV